MRLTPIALLTAATMSAALLATATRAWGDDAPQQGASYDAAALAREALPNSPDLVMGTLPNGLSYIIKKHSNPPGRIAVQMHVSSGSLNESDPSATVPSFESELGSMRISAGASSARVL